MHAGLSIGEDVMGDVAEMFSLHGQGMTWKQLLLGPRNYGTLPVLIGDHSGGIPSSTAAKARSKMVTGIVRLRLNLIVK